MNRLMEPIHKQEPLQEEGILFVRIEGILQTIRRWPSACARGPGGGDGQPSAASGALRLSLAGAYGSACLARSGDPRWDPNRDRRPHLHRR